MILASQETGTAQGMNINDARYEDLIALLKEWKEGGVSEGNLNRERAMLAAVALTHFARSTGQNDAEPLTDIITDMLANLMHFCRLCDPEHDAFKTLLGTAERHFDAESCEERG